MLRIKSERGGKMPTCSAKSNKYCTVMSFVAAGMLQFREGSEKLPSESVKAPRTCLLLSSNAPIVARMLQGDDC